MGSMAISAPRVNRPMPTISISAPRINRLMVPRSTAITVTLSTSTSNETGSTEDRDSRIFSFSFLVVCRFRGFSEISCSRIFLRNQFLSFHPIRGG